MSSKEGVLHVHPDKNLTVWQRIQWRVEPLLGRDLANEVATVLLPYVMEEKGK